MRLDVSSPPFSSSKSKEFDRRRWETCTSISNNYSIPIMFHLQFLNKISPISLVKPSEEIDKFANHEVGDLPSCTANERAKLSHNTGPRRLSS